MRMVTPVCWREPALPLWAGNGTARVGDGPVVIARLGDGPPVGAGLARDRGTCRVASKLGSYRCEVASKLCSYRREVAGEPGSYRQVVGGLGCALRCSQPRTASAGIGRANR